MKECNTCNEIKPLEAYYTRAARCKTCCVQAAKQWKKSNRERALEHQRTSNKNRQKQRRIENNMRKARVKTATPPWVDRQEIKYIYTLAAERSLVVDHIVPLNHKLVCGLHVPENLRCIPVALNASKSNKFNQECASAHAAVAASFGIRALSKWGSK
jgi:hypothetical protein